MKQAIIRKQVVTEEYVALSTTRLVASVDISCLPANTGNVLFKVGDDENIEWIPGEWHHFENIDLSTIQIKGTADDEVTVVGFGA